MTNDKADPENKALHDLLEDEFQQLIDFIEQKQIIHETISIAKDDASKPENSESDYTSDSIQDVAKRLQQHSKALGADTLTEYFEALETSMSNGNSNMDDELLEDIRNEFVSVKDILEISEDKN